MDDDITAFINSLIDLYPKDDLVIDKNVFTKKQYLY